MAQLFHPSTNTFSKFSIFGVLLVIILLAAVAGAVNRSSYVTQAGVVLEQPVQFSHKHHVGSLGIDCRFCHTSVEDSSFAGIPPTKTCMTCHSQVWADSPALAPVRESFATGAPIQWTRVHDLPDYAYFNHSIHLNKGVACVTCHGPVDQMPLMWRANSLHMEWCLDCHRRPEAFIRPRELAFDLREDWATPASPTGRQLLADYHIQVQQLLDCSMCHR